MLETFFNSLRYHNIYGISEAAIRNFSTCLLFNVLSQLFLLQIVALFVVFADLIEKFVQEVHVHSQLGRDLLVVAVILVWDKDLDFALEHPEKLVTDLSVFDYHFIFLNFLKCH